MAADPTLDIFRLDGMVALVTGASSGLGARFARVLSAAGARVAVAARREDRLTALVKELDGALPVVVDLARPGEADRLVDEVNAHFGRLDVLVNNAGVSRPKPAMEETAEEFRAVCEVNLVAPFALARRAAALMIDNDGGSVVNIASMLGQVGLARIPQASYAASKGGVVNLTRELAAQWARQGVRVNAIGPGWFPSEMTEDLFSDEGGQNWIRRGTPMGRGGQQHELDGALLFLASRASSYMTGQMIVVDGGWTCV